MHPTRWGILSAGMVSNDFCAALLSQPPGEHEIVAVGTAGDIVRAKQFAEGFKIKTYYGCYDDLVNDKDVDVVYIGNIVQFHRNVCIMALNANKNVLCETPMCMNLEEANEVISLAQEKRLFFMEGFWSRCFPAYQKLREEMEMATIGEPTVITVTQGFGILAPERKLSMAGAFRRSGCYGVMLANLIFREDPEKIVATGDKCQSLNVDLWDSATLHYSKNRCCIITVHSGMTLSNEAVVYGQKGHIRIPLFVRPASIVTPSGTFEEPLPEVSLATNVPGAEGFLYEQNHVRECLKKGLTESPLMPHSDSLQVMAIVDEVRRQVEVK